MKALHTITSLDARRRHVGAWLIALSCAFAGRVGSAGDDVVVESSAAPSTPGAAGQQVLVGNVIIRGDGRAVVFGAANRQPQYDLGGLFDQHVFGRLAAGNQVFIINGQSAPRGTSALEQALAAVRERCQQRVEMLETVCHLDASQVRTLAMALESDLKRVESQIAAERERYEGRTMPATPQGLDRAVLEEVRDTGLKCRRLLDALPGAGSLLGSVVHETLSPAQADRFAAWLEGRRACRWRAMVKTVLVQLDESGLGLSSKQAMAIEKSLRADVPPLAVLGDGPLEQQARQALHFQTILVKNRLRLRAIEWEHLLDPRQHAMLTIQIESTGDPATVERMLVEQGLLDPDTRRPPRQETP
jgi:hypothetical protein